MSELRSIGLLAAKGIVLSIGMVALTGCLAPLGNPLPRPVAMGRTDDGRFGFVVPLCDGEAVSSIEVEDHQTGRPVWKVSQPTRPEERNGAIVFGDAGAFAKQEMPLQQPLPPGISVSVQLSNGIFGRPRILAGRGTGAACRQRPSL